MPAANKVIINFDHGYLSAHGREPPLEHRTHGRLIRPANT